jgi:hypothetical protein
VLEPALDELRELDGRRLAVQYGFERLGADVGVGHPGVGELPDVGRDPVQLLERAPPGDGTGPAGGDQRAVDVEEQDAMRARHGGRLVLESAGIPRACRRL